MDNLEKELYRLSKVEPSSKFCRQAKDRLIHKITLSANEAWFLRLFKKVFSVSPSPYFIERARVRLLEQIEAMKRPVFSWLLFTKRVVATTLVMLIAVTTTLFFVDGKQQVNASEPTYLEVTGGEVAVKHADRLIWDVINQQTELMAGDLIRVGDSASAVIHFFDDSEIRLSEDASLLLSRLDVSPGYARQGIIEVSLHQGRAWVQTLNADDGYARFALVTPDAIVSTQYASFDVETNLFAPTVIRVFKRGVEVKALRQESRDVLASGMLNTYQKVTLEAATPYQPSADLSVFAPIYELTDEDRGEAWASQNLEADRAHLAQLRDRELITLRATTGFLPGQVLYPVKRAKERLQLAFAFNEENQQNTQVAMANERLSEALVLIEQGQTDPAKLALMEYQHLVRQITEAKTTEEVKDQLSNQVVATHQKTLVAALPGDARVGIIKQALDQTKELLAENPVERAQIRLKNSLEDMIHVQELVEAGDIESAEETLVDREIMAVLLLEEASALEDEEQKKVLFTQILDTQYEEQRILNELNRQLADTEGPLAALIENAHLSIKEDIKHTAAVVQPLLPDVVLSEAVILPEDEKVIEFVNKVNIYSTAQGQANQIKRLLTKHPQYAQNQEFLTKVRDRLDARSQDQINVYLLELKREATEAKSKVVKRKIDQAKRAMEDRR
ncbi:FecR domain-containing protein [Candidatus Peregrinibacteria bacterium]|nr:FecR domain-containing protein [Candidatus Peregrinibacteria bacterium]